ncbi:MAG: DUF389 domain-containing protein [Nostocoides sp.]
MIHLRLSVPTALSAAAVEALSDDPAVSSLSVVRGASLKPVGDVVDADVAREAANDLIDRLRALGVHHEGTLQVEQVPTWLSRSALDAELSTPGSSADAVVWADVTERAYGDTELNWTFLSFMTLATLIAGIAIILDSQILTIGAMVLGPDFGAVAALALALVRGRWHLLRLAARSLVVGLVVAVLLTAAFAVVVRALGWVTAADISQARPATDFIYHPNRWSFIVAVIAAAAGVLSLTSSKVGGLSGVFISVTTIPAAGNVALGLAFGLWGEVRGSALQLLVNIVGMAVAGWLTLLFQQAVWSRISAARRQMIVRRTPSEPGDWSSRR